MQRFRRQILVASLLASAGFAACLYPNGRFRVRADYEFQRIDREVNGVDLPIQLSRATIGVELGF